ncbi:NEW3 domain-containing protein, partial [Streptomyces sp. NPDC001759]
WVPGADLRDLERLPLLVVAGADAAGDAKAVDALIADLDDAVVRATAAGGGEALPPGDAWDGRGFAVLNRGTPGCVVTSSGDLYMSLMRSCTGWPSGIWVDPPRRTAPDGSGFQLQRWSHTFEYAVVAGAGDWREQRLPRLGHEFNHRLTARPRGGADGARLPRESALLTVKPAGEALLDALKPAGSPLARGSVAPADPGRGVVVRMHEVNGRPVRARVRGPKEWVRGARADVLETPRESLAPDGQGALDVGLSGFEVATLLATPPESGGGPYAPGVAAHEPAQPVHTRYWLHNSGPAPRGNMPVTVYVSPATLTASGAPVTATVRIASELTDAPVSGTVAVGVPPGWRAEPAEVPYELGPGGFTLTEVTVTPPPDAAPGRHWLTARLAYEGQTYEDVVGLDVPGAPVGPTLLTELEAERITVRRGERARVPVSLRNTTRGPVDGTLWAVSSWGTWAGVGPACQGFTVPAGGELEAFVDVDAGAVAPGSYWLMAKVAWHGRVAYTKAVALEVTP